MHELVLIVPRGGPSVALLNLRKHLSFFLLMIHWPMNIFKGIDSLYDTFCKYLLHRNVTSLFQLLMIAKKK